MRWEPTPLTPNPQHPKRELDHSPFGGITHNPRLRTTITAQVFRQFVWVLVHDGDDGYNNVFRQQNFQFLWMALQLKSSLSKRDCDKGTLYQHLFSI